MKLGFLRRLAAAGSRRKGSALLIVLGFVSFMLVSAVAFSVYMRTERLSSSGYRNSVSTRHFCRATLAFAKDAIEESFEGEDHAHLAHRFPGLGELSGRWKGRVLYPKGKTVERFTDTVATLSMEGLAYIPPAAVNDARQHSRHTSTAIWQRFNFEIARCAYTVLNVSDFLDVNKLRPGARTSGAFDRISLAYLWMDGSGEKFDPGDDSGAAAEDFGKFLDNRGSGSSGVPFVSLMDFNAALAKSTKSSFKELGMLSPYYEYLLGGQGKAKGRTNLFYEGAEEPSHLENGDILKSARRGWFVTDSWSTNRWPKEKNPGKGYYANLAYAEGQPFQADVWKQNNDKMSIKQIFKKRTITNGTPWKSGANLTKGDDGEDPIVYGPELATILFDYLDMDDTPVSLAMPCTERAPMVAAVELGVDDNGVTVYRSQSGGECGIRVAVNEQRVRLLLQQYIFDAHQHSGCHLCMAAAGDPEVIIRRGYLHLAEKDGGHIVVKMLSGMYQNFLMFFSQLARPRRCFNKLRACADYGYDFHRAFILRSWDCFFVLQRFLQPEVS